MAYESDIENSIKKTQSRSRLGSRSSNRSNKSNKSANHLPSLSSNNKKTDVRLFLAAIGIR